MLLTLPASSPVVPSLPKKTGKTRQSKLECLSQEINIDDVALFEKRTERGSSTKRQETLQRKEKLHSWGHSRRLRWREHGKKETMPSDAMSIKRKTNRNPTSHLLGLAPACCGWGRESVQGGKAQGRGAGGWGGQALHKMAAVQHTCCGPTSILPCGTGQPAQRATEAGGPWIKGRAWARSKQKTFKAIL